MTKSTNRPGPINNDARRNNRRALLLRTIAVGSIALILTIFVLLQSGGQIVAASARPDLFAALTVTNTNDSGAGSLRQAVLDAVPGDTIVFAVTGTITLTTGEIVVNKNLTITGPGSSVLAVSGNNASRILSIGNPVTISG